jgi:hypothetical protein
MAPSSGRAMYMVVAQKCMCLEAMLWRLAKCEQLHVAGRSGSWQQRPHCRLRLSVATAKSTSSNNNNTAADGIWSAQFADLRSRIRPCSPWVTCEARNDERSAAGEAMHGRQRRTGIRLRQERRCSASAPSLSQLQKHRAPLCSLSRVSTLYSPPPLLPPPLRPLYRPSGAHCRTHTPEAT